MDLRVGEIVGVPVFGFVMHVGLFTERQTVIANSMRNGCVVEQSLTDFAEGKQITQLGYPSSLPTSVVIGRARSKLGEQWSLFGSNCEHFVRWAHGLKPTSPQVLRSLAAFALIARLSRHYK